MMVSVAFVLDDELEFETDFRFEFLQIEIPLPHFVRVGECSPNSRDGRVKASFHNNCTRNIALGFHDLSLVFGFIFVLFVFCKYLAS